MNTTTDLSSAPRRPTTDDGDEQVDERVIRRRHGDFLWILGDDNDNHMLDISLSSSARSSLFSLSSSFRSASSSDSSRTGTNGQEQHRRRSSRTSRGNDLSNNKRPQKKVIDFVKRSASKLNTRRNDILNDWNEGTNGTSRSDEGFESILFD